MIPGISMKQYTVEVCVASVESAISAQEAGAGRVELCAGLPEGGTTPSFGEIKIVRELLTKTKVNILIRPRGGDFLYTTTELKIMLQDIESSLVLGVDGFVLGCLTRGGDIDKKAMKQLIDATSGKPVTFHRAFDMCRDPYKALDEIISLGCKRILTSGQRSTAEEGIPLIKELVKRAGNDIIIMPGSGINPANISKIATETGAKEFHFSARKSLDSKMEYRNSSVSMGGTVHIDEYRIQQSDPDIIKNMIQELDQSL